MNIASVHLSNGNVGDRSCSPLDSFDLQFSRFLFKKAALSQLVGHHLIIGGGGLFFPGGRRWILGAAEFMRANSPASKLIIWGAGSNSPLKKPRFIPFWLGLFDLVGLRDFGNPIHYVPCASCLRSEFNAPRPAPQHDVIIFEHLANPVKTPALAHAPRMASSHKLSLSNALDFLASGQTIVTSSFHGAYWGLLLARRVVLYKPPSTRFISFPVRLPFIGDEPLSTNFAGLAIPNFLDDCRGINMRFAREVFSVLNIPQPEMRR